jgi:hypothetical protein
MRFCCEVTNERFRWGSAGDGFLRRRRAAAAVRRPRVAPAAVHVQVRQLQPVRARARVRAARRDGHHGVLPGGVALQVPRPPLHAVTRTVVGASYKQRARWVATIEDPACTGKKKVRRLRRARCSLAGRQEERTPHPPRALLSRRAGRPTHVLAVPGRGPDIHDSDSRHGSDGLALGRTWWATVAGTGPGCGLWPVLLHTGVWTWCGRTGRRAGTGPAARRWRRQGKQLPQAPPLGTNFLFLEGTFGMILVRVINSCAVKSILVHAIFFLVMEFGALAIRQSNFFFCCC